MVLVLSSAIHVERLMLEAASSTSTSTSSTCRRRHLSTDDDNNKDDHNDDAVVDVQNASSKDHSKQSISTTTTTSSAIIPRGNNSHRRRPPRSSFDLLALILHRYIFDDAFLRAFSSDTWSLRTIVLAAARVLVKMYIAPVALPTIGLTRMLENCETNDEETTNIRDKDDEVFWDESEPLDHAICLALTHGESKDVVADAQYVQLFMEWIQGKIAETLPPQSVAVPHPLLLKVSKKLSLQLVVESMKHTSTSSSAASSYWPEIAALLQIPEFKSRWNQKYVIVDSNRATVSSSSSMEHEMFEKHLREILQQDHHFNVVGSIVAMVLEIKRHFCIVSECLDIAFQVVEGICCSR